MPQSSQKSLRSMRRHSNNPSSRGRRAPRLENAVMAGRTPALGLLVTASRGSGTIPANCCRLRSPHWA